MTDEHAIEEVSLAAGGLTWEAGVAGPEEGEPIVLLHGFPENWQTWTPVMSGLAGEGFRVFAPCLPGYGGTSAPESYRIDDLGAAIAAFCETVGEGRPVHLVGHDWGGIIASSTASLHPEPLRSITLACCTHPAAFSGGLTDLAQVKRSLYVGLFQVPGVEHLVLRGLVSKTFPRSVVAISDIEEMRRALEYYRTNLRPWNLNSSRAGRIAVPGLVVFAERDIAIGEDLMRKTAEQIDDLRGFEVVPSGHFFHRRHPELFLAPLLPFLRETSGQG